MLNGRQTRASRRASGPPPAAAFSLLELVLVVAILAVVAAVAAPRYGRAAARYRAELAAQRIAADLDLARRSARAAGVSRSVVFSVATQSYSLPGQGGMERKSATYTISLASRPYEVRLLTADFGGDGTVVFNGYGVADSDGTVLLQAGQERRTVVFRAASGKATVE